MAFRLLIALLQTFLVAHAFYLPGWSIKSYKDGEQVPLYVNKIMSDATQLPFTYHDLPFVCKSPRVSKELSLNLGEILSGDRLWSSDYKLSMAHDSACETLCQVKVDKEGLQRAAQLIKEHYNVEWVVDNLPGASVFVSLDKTSRKYSPGFPLGALEAKSNKIMIHNHVMLVLRHRKHTDGNRVIVGFEVYPRSVGSKSKKCPSQNDKVRPFYIDPEKKSATIPFTYSVIWREDNSIDWHTRWNVYLANSEKTLRAHWLSLAHSCAIVLLLASVVATSVLRSLRRDFQEKGDDEDGGIGSPGAPWKLLNTEVMRLPRYRGLLRSLLSSGIQFFTTGVAVIALACLGILNPSYRGGFLSWTFFCLAFSGIVSGFVNAKAHMVFKHIDEVSAPTIKELFKISSGAALGVPAFLILYGLMLNVFEWVEHSSAAIPLTTIFAIMVLWLVISLPLYLVGGTIALRFTSMPHDLPRVSSIPRQLPFETKYLKICLRILGAGLLPFLVILSELIFIFHCFWQNKREFYYEYGFLASVLTLLLMTIVQVSCLMTYYQLNSLDYRWWWRSFYVGSASAWWILLFSIFYYLFILQIHGIVSTILYFGYSIMGCFIYGLVTGSVGLLTAFVFVSRLYRAIKVE